MTTDKDTDLTGIDLDMDDLTLDLSEDEERWEDLIDQIMAGNVIPVIGPDFQIDEQDNFHTQIINLFARKFGIKSEPRTFSQLIYSREFLSAVNNKPETIYRLICQVLTKVKKRPSDLLVRLLATKKFPFVITTSFTPVVESAMRQVWGDDKVGMLQFRNDPARDLKVDEGDVQNVKSMSQPTVFYMFGKYSEEKNRFVVTDVDMMEFCTSWLAALQTPRVLTEAIKQRYLLVLGNNYSDWLFRFICYALRSRAEDMRSSLMVNQHFADDAPLIQFLHRLETFIQKDAAQVVTEIERRLSERQQRMQSESQRVQTYRTDVFLSYSRSDEHLVHQLYDLLLSRGLRVWYDRQGIKEADNWRQAIVSGIRGSRIFVPILTANVENEILDVHEYRAEWKEAASVAGRMGGRTFIVPLAERGFDFYNQLTDVPEEFMERNATWFDTAADLSAIADVIVQRVEEVKQLEQQLGHGR